MITLKYILSALFITTILSACKMNNKSPELSYEGSRYLEYYPSGSAISLMDGKFYLMGDDASDLMVLDSNLKEIQRIQLFSQKTAGRISKTVKADIEASLTLKDRSGILFFGSGSVSPYRDSAFLVDPLNNNIQRLDLKPFYTQLRTQVDDLNIEAATLIGEEIVIGLRGNNTHPENYIIMAGSNISNLEFKGKIKLELPVTNIGISGMDYNLEKDLLFITFSTEDTSNSFDDGEIGDSYLALVYRVSTRIDQSELIIDSLIKLKDLSPDFRAQKVESVVFESKKHRLLLIADDDKGHTRLFTLKF